jgi:enoyl-CoA hydratase
MSDARLVEVYRAKDSPQAHVLRSALEDAGIHALVEGDLLQGALGELPVGWSTAPRIMVEEHDAPQARALLERWESSGPSNASEAQQTGHSLDGSEAAEMIERSLHEGILTLRLAHGKASALDVELLEALLRELEGVAEDVRALILTGTGSIFSAGVDLFRLTEGGADYVRRFLPLLSRVVRALFAFPRPVVVAANGHAVAGGCVLVLAADVRLIAAGTGRIGLPELLVGVPFPAAALEVVRFAVPRDKVQSLVYTGRTLPPQEALAAGLVDEVVPAEDLLARAQEVAHQLALIPPQAYRLTKQSVRAVALERMERAGEAQDRAVLEVWSAAETHAHVREYVRRTIRK